MRKTNGAKNQQNGQERLRTVELFAGVGGFRVGLERCSSPRRGYEIVWSNQWEPSTKKQHASEIYASVFGDENHSCEDIANVPTDEIPDHDLLTAGFPCQDYSVARTLSQASGLVGKKGVLWWEIYRILEEKGRKAPRYLMLENVDRLLKSPANQRGRDFAIMLASLANLGYAVEWRVINAADYGMPQRRRRVYILGYKKGTPEFEQLEAGGPERLMSREGLMARSFPAVPRTDEAYAFDLDSDLERVTNRFNTDAPKTGPFENSGIMVGHRVYTLRTDPKCNGPRTVLRDVLLDDKEVPEEYFISKNQLREWKYLKDAKDEPRRGKNGFTYQYKEGPVSFPDALDRPSRTVVTGEGGSSPSRFKHVVRTRSGRYRRLTPVELERLNMFPDGHTEGASDVRRAFFMGNALVVGIVEKLGKELLKSVSPSPSRANRTAARTSRASRHVPKPGKLPTPVS